jgi:Tir chaperone protein (CesT) family
VDHKIRSVFADFGNTLGITLVAEREVNLLTTNSGDKYWIEAPRNSSLIVIHTNLSKLSAIHASKYNLERWLELNTEIDMMRGAYLGIHKETQQIKLCVALYKKSIDSELLKSAFDSLMETANHISQQYSQLN